MRTYKVLYHYMAFHAIEGFFFRSLCGKLWCKNFNLFVQAHKLDLNHFCGKVTPVTITCAICRPFAAIAQW